MNVQTGLLAVLTKHRTGIMDEWAGEQKALAPRGIIKDNDLQKQCSDFLDAVTEAVSRDAGLDSRSAAWGAARELLAEFSRTRAAQGFSASETATFVFSLKKTLFEHLREEMKSDPQGLIDAICAISYLLTGLGLYTTEVFQKAREGVITRQQQELLELSTPVIKLWDRILAVPLIGTLDSNRTQIVMESLLQEIMNSGSEIAIIDITGVPTVDTLVAQHLMKTIAATRLMGAECILSGIRPQIAQTIVHLGVELNEVVTKATLADAFALALRRTGASLSRVPVAP